MAVYSRCLLVPRVMTVRSEATGVVLATVCRSNLVVPRFFDCGPVSYRIMGRVFVPKGPARATKVRLTGGSGEFPVEIDGCKLLGVEGCGWCAATWRCQAGRPGLHVQTFGGPLSIFHFLW